MDKKLVKEIKHGKAVLHIYDTYQTEIVLYAHGRIILSTSDKKADVAYTNMLYMIQALNANATEMYKAWKEVKTTFRRMRKDGLYPVVTQGAEPVLGMGQWLNSLVELWPDLKKLEQAMRSLVISRQESR